MSKKQKHTIEIDYLDLKNKFKANQLTTKQVDQITCKLIAELALLTTRGITEINSIPIDLMKDRVWWIIENAGLLPEYRDPGEDLSELEEVEDDYYKVDDEFDCEVDDSKFYK
jgi:hypothetical protein